MIEPQFRFDLFVVLGIMVGCLFVIAVCSTVLVLR